MFQQSGIVSLGSNRVQSQYTQAYAVSLPAMSMHKVDRQNPTRSDRPCLFRTFSDNASAVDLAETTEITVTVRRRFTAKHLCWISLYALYVDRLRRRLVIRVL